MLYILCLSCDGDRLLSIEELELGASNMGLLNFLTYPPTARISTGLVAWYQGRLVLALAQVKYWSSNEAGVSIPVIGIGGGMEPGETLLAAVAREAREEASVAISIQGAQSTLLLSSNDVLEERDFSGKLAEEPAPLLVWQRQVTLRDDCGNPYDRDYVNAVYEAMLSQQPYPSSEIPGLLFMPVAVFLALLEQPTDWNDLQQQGVEYLGKQLPTDAAFYLQGSAEFVARHWHRLAGAVLSLDKQL